MIFATAKSLRKLDDAGLKRSASTWRYAQQRARILGSVPAILIAAACLTALAFVPTAPFVVAAAIVTTDVTAGLAVRLLARHNIRGLERETGARARDASIRAASEADWLPPPAPPAPSPAQMPDLGHDFRNGTERDVDVKPALKLKPTSPPDARPR